MAYTDLSGTYFNYKHLVQWSWFDALAENDEYDRIPVGSVKTFYQAAAPTGWTQVTTQNDKALRVVSGSGGGSGGAVAISTGFTLAHSHTVNSHTHAQPDHTHQLDYDTASFASPVGSLRTDASDGSHVMVSAGAVSSGWFECFSATANSGSSTNTGSAAPGTDTQLSNVTLAYIDLILASKN